MRQKSKPAKEKTTEALSYKVQVPKKNATPERKKIRQLLRSLLPMEEYQREIKEEQNLFK